jgi:uncharacterized protein YrzB (UPF0473 family)
MKKEEDISIVTLDTDDGALDFRILTIFDADRQDYIVLQPLKDVAGSCSVDDIFIYRYVLDEDGEPSIENIEDEDEWDMVNEYFESLYAIDED